MCGICGIVHVQGMPDRDALERMISTLNHRGPDERGLWIDKNVGLGHTRLSIIDLQTGQQPMHDHLNQLHLVFNGELYNYRELGAELQKEGFIARTSSDTEVVLLAYRAWGIDCLKRFVGMFAFALWDDNQQHLFLARDHLGQKPLHYYLDSEFIVFASEIKALLQHPEISGQLDPDSLSKFFAYDYVPAPRSIYKGIKKLLPGCYALWKAGNWQENHYWQPNFSASCKMTEPELLESLDELLRESTRQHLVSDVPVGIFLSGGIDSSTVLSYAAEFHSGRIQTFNISFDEASFDESQYAKQVAQHFATDHHETVLSSQQAFNLIPSLADFLDEPMADPSIIPTYLLSQHTCNHVKVALGGDGGDETFVGYENYRAAKFLPRYMALPKWLRQRLIEPLIAQLPVSERNLTLGYKLKRFIKGARFPLPICNYVWLGPMNVEEQRELFQNDFHQQL